VLPVAVQVLRGVAQERLAAVLVQPDVAQVLRDVAQVLQGVEQVLHAVAEARDAAPGLPVAAAASDAVPALHVVVEASDAVQVLHAPAGASGVGWAPGAAVEGLRAVAQLHGSRAGG